MRRILLFTALATQPAMILAQTPTLGGCSIFPADNVWNTPINTLPVDSHSAAYVASMDATNNRLHPDFGHGGGMPYNLVPDSQPKVTIPFYYTSDPGPYPIPDNVSIEGGSDGHAILVDTGTCELYEIFNLTGGPGSWAAGSGATWSLHSNALRTDGWTSADAAGLPILPGLVRYGEVESGIIRHAIRVTADHTRGAHIWPARHDASSLTGSEYPPMGQRFRLKASFDMSSYPAPVQVILRALKTYGMILADNGTSWHIQGVGDSRWNDDTMHAMTNVTGDNFEAVDESSLMIDPNSAQVPAASSSIPTGWVNIISKNSGKCLDLTGGSAATWNGDPAEQWTCWDGPNQQFKFIPVSGGYEVSIRSGGLALDVRGGSAAVANGTRIQQWSYWGGSNQIWNPVPTSDGYYSLIAQNSGACLDVRDSSTLNGAPVQQWACSGSDNQKWSFVPAS